MQFGVLKSSWGEGGGPEKVHEPYRNFRISEGPSTQYLRSLVSNASKSMVVGTRNLKDCVLGPSGVHIMVVYMGPNDMVHESSRLMNFPCSNFKHASYRPVFTCIYIYNNVYIQV